jgi:hypothetical protein
MNNKLLITGIFFIGAIFAVYYVQTNQTINSLSDQLKNVASTQINKADNQQPSDNTILFDGCGELNTYKEEVWYPVLTKQIDTIITDARSSDTLVPDEDYPIEDKFISENSSVCYSLNKNMAILLFNSRYYMEESDIYRFDIAKGELEKPTFKNTPYPYVVAIQDFDKVQGNIFYLESDFGDGGVAGTNYYHYDVLANTITLVKTYDKETISNDPYQVSGEWIYY